MRERESKFVINLVSIFGKQRHITMSGDVTGLTLCFRAIIRESVRVFAVERDEWMSYSPVP